MITRCAAAGIRECSGCYFGRQCLIDSYEEYLSKISLAELKQDVCYVISLRGVFGIHYEEALKKFPDKLAAFEKLMILK